MLFWNAPDLHKKLTQFQHYYHHHRSHDALANQTPLQKAKEPVNSIINLNNFHWQSYRHHLFQRPAAA